MLPINVDMVEEQINEVVIEQRAMSADIERLNKQQAELYEQFRRFRIYTDKMYQSQLQLMKDVLAAKEIAPGHSTVASLLSRSVLTNSTVGAAEVLKDERNQGTSIGNPNAVVVGHANTVVSAEEAGDAHQYPLRILVSRKKYLRAQSDEEITESIKQTAMDFNCVLEFSHEFFPGTTSYVLNVEKMGIGVGQSPQQLICNIIELMFELSRNRLEFNVLVPEGIAMELSRERNKLLHALAAKSMCELTWAATEPKFAPEPHELKFKKETEKELPLRVRGKPHQIQAIFEELYLRQVDRIEGSSDTDRHYRLLSGGPKKGTDAGILLAEEDGVDEDFDDYAKKEEENAFLLRRAQFYLERNDVQTKMANYGLTEELNKDAEKEDIQKAKKRYWNEKNWRYYPLAITQNIITQRISVALIILNVVVMWIQIDLENDEIVQQIGAETQYAFTTIFMIEAMCNLVSIPGVHKRSEIFLDIIICTAAFIVETIEIAELIDGRNLNFLLMLRMIRFLRFARIIRRAEGARTVRVLFAGFAGALWNFCWTMVFLIVLFVVVSILFRSFFKQTGSGKSSAEESCNMITEKVLCEFYTEFTCVWTEGRCKDELSNIRFTYFPTVQATVLTLIDSFAGGFDSATQITRPLLNSGDSQYVACGWIFLIWTLIMKLVILNIITGFFIEQLTKDATISDEEQQKEKLVGKHVTINSIERAFRLCDASGSKGNAAYELRLSDFVNGVRKYSFVRDLCEIEEFADDEATYTAFNSMDSRGDGRLSFSDFAFGILALKCKGQSIDKMLFDNASKNLIRQSAQSVAALKDTSAIVKRSSWNVHYMSEYLFTQKEHHYALMAKLSHDLKHICKKVDDVFNVLDLQHPDTDESNRKHLINVANVREARTVMEEMNELKGTMAEASDAATHQTEAAKECLDSILHKFRAEAKEDMTRYLNKLREEGAIAAAAATAAARAAAANSAVLAPPDREQPSWLPTESRGARPPASQPTRTTLMRLLMGE